MLNTKLEKIGYAVFVCAFAANFFIKRLGHPDLAMTFLIVGFVSLVLTAVFARRARNARNARNVQKGS